MRRKQEAEIHGKIYTFKRMVTFDPGYTPDIIGLYEDDRLVLIITQDNAEAIHNLSGLTEPCSDDNCPCFESGYNQAQEHVGDWRTPLGY